MKKVASVFFPKEFELKNGKILEVLQPVGGDAKQVLNYLKEVGGETDNFTFGAEGLPFSVEQEAAFLETCRKSKIDLAIMGKIDGKIVGFLNFTRTNRPRLVHLGEFGISVSKKYWGIGIGSKMIECLIEWSRAHGLKKIELKVRKDNLSAIELYKKFGFKEEGIRRKGLFVNNEFFDEIYMGLLLNGN